MPAPGLGGRESARSGQRQRPEVLLVPGHELVDAVAMALAAEVFQCVGSRDASELSAHHERSTC